MAWGAAFSAFNGGAVAEEEDERTVSFYKTGPGFSQDRPVQ
jgi:hypothetical protein